MTSGHYLRLARDRWLTLVFTTLFFCTAALTYSLLAQPVYESRTQLFVSAMTQGQDTAQLSQGENFMQQRVKSYAKLVTSPRVLQPVIERLALRTTATELAQRIAATTTTDTVLIDVIVHDVDPERASDVSNAIASQFPQLVNQLETPIGQNTSPVRVSITLAATPATAPIWPHLQLNIALGMFIGLLCGLGIALIQDTLDKTVKDRDEIQRSTTAPVLTAVHDDPECVNNRLITHDPFSPRAEEFRQLRTNIRFLSVDHPVKSLVVTSAVPREGKSTTAANLAIALAQSGEDVVLIDADLRRPSLADVLALTSGVGLTSVLLGDLTLAEAMQPWGDLPLRVLTSGPLPPNPAELIGSSRMATLIDDLIGSGSTVILDAPPLLPVTDSALLARATDGALIVVHAGKTHSEQLASACESLRIAGAAVLGVVLNRSPRRKSAGSYGTYEGYNSNGGRVTQNTDRELPRIDRVGSLASIAQSSVHALGETDQDVTLGVHSPLSTLGKILSPSSEFLHHTTSPQQQSVAPPTDLLPSNHVFSPTPPPLAVRQVIPAVDVDESQINFPGAEERAVHQGAETRRRSRRDSRSASNRNTSHQRELDLVVDADAATATFEDPGTWHREWGDLPVLVGSPRANVDINGHVRGSSGRHRN